MKKVKLGKFSFQDAVWGNVSDEAKDFIHHLLTVKVTYSLKDLLTASGGEASGLPTDWKDLHWFKGLARI